MTSSDGYIWVLQRNTNEAVITAYNDDGTTNNTPAELRYTPFSQAEGVAFWNNTFLLVQNGSPGSFAFIDYFAITATINDLTQIVSVNPAITPNADINADLVLTAHQPSVGDITATLPIRIGNVPVWGSIGVFNATELVSWSYDVTNIDITGSTPITYRLGTAPSWVSFTGTTLSGTPPDVVGDQIYTVEVIAENALGSDTGTFTVSVPDDSVEAPVWSSISTLTFRTDMSNSFNLNNFVNGIPDPTIAVQTGTLQSGISLVGGVLSGIPTDIVNRSITFRATNSEGTADEQVNINVLQPPSWSTIPTQTFTVGDTVNVALSSYASGFPAPSFTATNLPAGLSVNLAGFLTGTPTAVGTEAVIITALNAGGAVQTTFDVTVESAITTTPRFYVLDNTFDFERLRVFSTAGVEDTGDRIDLGVGSWGGGFEYNSFFYLVDNSSDNLGVWNIAGVRQSGMDIDLPSGGWRGGFEYDDHFYLTNNTNDTLSVWDSAGNRQSGMDISLGTGSWQGGFEYNNHFYVVNNSTRTLGVWDSSGTRQSGMDISIGIGNWQGGFEYNDFFYLVDDSPNTLKVWDSSGNRQSSMDISLGSGRWEGGFFSDATAAPAIPLAPVWNTIPDQLFAASRSVSFDVSGYIAQGDAPITFTATGLTNRSQYFNGGCNQWDNRCRHYGYGYCDRYKHSRLGRYNV